jgi:hypothetical protein
MIIVWKIPSWYDCWRKIQKYLIMDTLHFHFAGTPGRLNDYLEAGMVQKLCIQKNESHKKGVQRCPKVSKGLAHESWGFLRFMFSKFSWTISENLLEIQQQTPMPSNAAGWRIDTWELQESGFGWGAQCPGRPGRPGRHGNLSPNPSPTTSRSPGRSHVRHGFRATVPWLPGFPLNRSTLLQKNTHMGMGQN